MTTKPKTPGKSKVLDKKTVVMKTPAKPTPKAPAKKAKASPVKPEKGGKEVAGKPTGIKEAAKAVKPVVKAPAKKAAVKKAVRSRVKFVKKSAGESGDMSVKVDHLSDSRAGEDTRNISLHELPIKWQLFISEYMVDLNGTQAAIRAGYMPSSASDRAARLLARPDINSVVQALVEDRVAQIRMTRERVLSEFENIAEADANELCELRRVCCRHCWGEIDAATEAPAYQFTPAEYVEKKARWEEERARKLDAKGGKDIGEFPHQPGDWYDKRKPINERCTECFGDGIQDVFLKDTRNISRRARSIYGGVKEGKDGIEIKTYSREAALQVLAKHHKIYDEAPTVNLNMKTSDELNAIYEEAMQKIVTSGEKVKGRMGRVKAGINAEK